MAWVALVAALPGRAAGPPQPVWRVGYLWSFTEQAHGLDWGLGVRMLLRPTEIGLVSLDGSLEGTGPGLGVGEWAFHLGAVVERLRPRATYGLYYALRDPGSAVGVRGPLTGIALRWGDLRASIFPGSWNPGVLGHTRTVAVVEPGWFGGLYLQLRWMMAGSDTSLRLAFGLEEGW